MSFDEENLSEHWVCEAEIAKLEAVNAQLLAACEAAEWKGRESWSPNHISKDGTVCTTWSQGCPCCTRHIETGHAPNCQLAAAIKAAKGEGGRASKCR